MQWFVMFVIGALAMTALHLIVLRRRKVAHEMPVIAMALIPVSSASDLLSSASADTRIAKIISEIPKRRVRH